MSTAQCRIVALLAMGALAPAACLAQTSARPPSLTPRPVNPAGNVSSTTTIQNPGVVSWVHFGDLHITDGSQLTTPISRRSSRIPTSIS